MLRQWIVSTLLLCMSFPVCASADLVGRWRFDEGTGDTAFDTSGQGNHGTVYGDAAWAEGQIRGALILDGVDDYVDLPIGPLIATLDNATFTVWVDFSNAGGAWQRIFDFGTGTANYILLSPRTGTTGPIRVAITANTGQWTDLDGPMTLPSGWHHMAVSIEAGTKDLRIYLDGEVVANMTSLYTVSELGETTQNWLGRSQYVADAYLNGALDDFRIYNEVLSQADIQQVMLGVDAEMASQPVPENEQTDVPRDSVLKWQAGKFAQTHNVYLGTEWADVNAADTDNDLGVLVSRNQDANTFAPDLLAYGQTYYWRVDEVNGAPDYTAFKGEVWRFASEPFAYPIQTITATASSAYAYNMGPERTIDGSGLNELDQHSVDGTHMWLSNISTEPAWIQYEFDKAYTLHEMWVWNSNQIIEAFMGLGARDVRIETSVDGTNWVPLEGVTRFAQASGSPDYTANTVVDFAGAQAQQVRITISSGYGMMPQYGLSEVRFFYIPTRAREPQPADGAVTSGADVTLSWRAGREAASHEVYLGTNPDDLSLIGSAAQSSYDLSAAGLAYGQTYFWQINEVNASATPSTHTGDIWRLTLPDFVTVEGFESYDDACKRIFFAWQDGWGHNGGENIADCDVLPYGGNGTGALVGHDQAPFAERTMVHTGRQSMPLGYEGNGSEAQLVLSSPQDWTLGGAQTLVLFFAGTPGNDTGQFYIKVNGTKVVHPSQTALQQPVWKQWNIDLSTLGSDLTSIRTLSLGVNSPGMGTVYVDDLRLYRDAPAVPVPVDPGINGLMAHYAMENNLLDSTGNGYDGVSPLVAAAFTSGPGDVGSALSLSGDDFGEDYIELPIGSLIASLSDATFAFWVNYSGQSGVWSRIFDFGSGTTQYIFISPARGGDAALLFEVNGPDAGTNLLPAPFTLPTGWHHVAGVVDSSSMEMSLYLDGTEVGRAPTDSLPRDMGETTQNWLGRSQYAADPYFNGALDDFRIYSRALPQEEILYLAGDR